MTTTWYHGTNANIVKFSDEFVGNGNDSFGPGIYLANDPTVAKTYGKNVYEVVVDNLKLAKTSKSRLTISKVQALIKKAPDFKDKLENWDESYSRAMMSATEAMLNGDTVWEILQNIWYDFYRYNPVEFVRNASAMGYDGAIIERNPGVLFLVLMNPHKIVSQKLSKAYSQI